jgi:hypothetical protein
MVPSLRQAFNAAFTPERYEAYIAELEALQPGALDFRNSETPIFIPRDFKDKVVDACERITDIIVSPNFKELTHKAVPANINIPGENEHTHFIAFDFGVCENEAGELEPQLIEMQGFPTLFAYQAYHTAITKKYAQLPDTYDAYLGGYDEARYLQLLKEIVVGSHPPENVILLEIFPEKQKTRIDFYSTQQALGVNFVCLTQLIKEDRQLFYMNNGVKTRIHRIYNRLIFDDLQQQSTEVQEKGKVLFEDLEVEWAGHPNWFYRISKYTLPFIRHAYVPETHFLSDVKDSLPGDLTGFVLKPLFSFAGQGVIIDVTQADVDAITDPENWILQKKVKYADVIITPDMPAKAEIRVFYFWKDGAPRPVAVHNLGRMSKGKMIGTRYNKDKDWVGGTVCFFEK